MNNFEHRLSSMLAYIQANGIFDQSKVTELETLVSECIKLHKDPNVEGVSDSIYDVLYAKLREVNPNSRYVTDIWEEGTGETDAYTDLLVKNPMFSILTAKSYGCKEFSSWVDKFPEGNTELFFSYKINGHGIRVVYDNGYLVSATSRARASKGNDITRQVRCVLGNYNESLEDYGVVEIRGELCLPLSNLDAARGYNPNIKSAFSGVASLVRPSSTEEECQLLDFLAYGFLCDGVSFDEKSDEYQLLEDCGFNVPVNGSTWVSKNTLVSSIKEMLTAFENNEYDYFCDGVVVEINNRELFRSLGLEGNHNVGNIAMKVGIWSQDQYVGYVQKIEYTRGKVKLSPVAIISDEPNAIIEDRGQILNYEDLGVLTAQGNKVRRVPLYEVKNILILEAYPGNLIHFRYGSEAGVVPCFPDGSVLGDDAVLDFVLQE